MRKQEIHKAIQFTMKEGFQKGKLEQIKKELDYWDILLSSFNLEELKCRIRIRREQLQKEIGGNSK